MSQLFVVSICSSRPIRHIWGMEVFTSGGKRGDYRNCSVLYCVLKLCSQKHA